MMSIVITQCNVNKILVSVNFGTPTKEWQTRGWHNIAETCRRIHTHSWSKIRLTKHNQKTSAQLENQASDVFEA